MGKDPTTKSSTSDVSERLRPAFIGCTLAVVIILLCLAAVLFLFNQSPYLQNLAECKLRMEQVGDALGRYETLNNRYPDKLSDLVPDYIPASVLHCPMEDKKSEEPEYTYTKQSIDASDNAVLLTCENHRLNSKMPGVVLRYIKSGVVIPVSAKDLPQTPKR